MGHEKNRQTLLSLLLRLTILIDYLIPAPSNKRKRYKQESVWRSYTGYRGIINHLAFFSTHNAGRKFLYNHIIVCSHYYRCTKVAGNMKQQLHNFIRGFGVKIPGRLIGQ